MSPADPRADRPRGRVLALDGLRGVAILWVLLHQLVVVPATSTWERVVLWPANFGWVGVTLFFVLSGYLITGVLLDTRDAPHRVSSFYARRALRILPLYLLLVAVVLAFSAWRGGMWGVDQLSTAQAASFWLLLGNWSQAAAGDFLVGPLAVTWSVAIEEQFYLVWPWVVWSCQPKTLARLCGAMILAILLGRVAAQLDGANPVMLYASTWTRLDALAIGSFAAVAARSGIPWNAAKRTLWVVFLLGTLSAAAFDLVGTLNRPTGAYFCPAPSLGYGITFGGLAAGALLLLLHDPAIAPRLTRCFEAGWLRSFGLYSYGIYLTHGPVRALIRDHLFGPGSEGATPLITFSAVTGSTVVAFGLYAITCLPLCWVVGWLSYRLIESPFLRYKPRFTAKESA